MPERYPGSRRRITGRIAGEYFRNVGYEDPPEESDVGRGLVASEDYIVVNKRGGAVFLSALLELIGLKERGDQIILGIFNQERQVLAEEMAKKGLLGERPLFVGPQVLREQVSSSHGSVAGSLLLGISGEYEGTARSVSRVQFAWQAAQGRIVFSEVDLECVEVLLEEKKADPTVEFKFNLEKLINTTRAMVVARRTFGHPNGYINSAVARVIFRAQKLTQLSTFLVKVARPVQSASP